MPLAIELAAARANILNPEEMLDRLRSTVSGGVLGLLTRATRDAPTRHQTLRDAIDWSHSLLGTDCRRLFRCLSVFIGDFTLEAAHAVLASMIQQDLWDNTRLPRLLLDEITQLVEDNLQRIPRPEGETRFMMLETIREYGNEQLEIAGELTAARWAHAAYFLSIAKIGEREAGGPRQAEWLDKLDADHPNLRSALAWLYSEGDPVAGAELASTLWCFWFRRDYLREGSSWVQKACASENSTLPDSLTAKLLTADGSFARMLGDFSRAERILEASEALWRSLGDTEGLAWTLSHLGLVKQWLGHLDIGVCLLDESLSLRIRAGDLRGIARSLFNLAVAEDFRRNYPKASELYQETLGKQRQLGDIWGMGRVNGYLAKVLIRHDDISQAEDRCYEALRLSSKVAVSGA